MIISRTTPVAVAAYSIVDCISLLDTTELEIVGLVSDTDRYGVCNVVTIVLDGLIVVNSLIDMLAKSECGGCTTAVVASIDTSVVVVNSCEDCIGSIVTISVING